MNRFKLLNVLLSILVIASLLMGGTGQVGAEKGTPGNGKKTGQMRSTTKAQRQSARFSQAPQQKGVTTKYAGVNPATAAFSALTNTVSTLATMANPLSMPDYFGVANWALSPLPQLDANGAVISGTGIRKFVDTLPGLNQAGANDLGQFIPVASASAVFPNSDYYEIAVVEYMEQLHMDLPATKLRGYVQLVPAGTPGAVALTTANGLTQNLTKNGAQLYGAAKPNYLGPVILATRNTPVRVKFTNLLPTGQGGDLMIPMDNTYMGAGMGPGGSIEAVNVTDKGLGYSSVPNVNLNGGGGTGAAATANLINGQVVSITVTNGGSGYTSAPTVSLSGGKPITPAIAAAVLAGQPGEMYTPNRATLHLHGGNSPWISDGTPHQWTTPAGELTSYSKGASVSYVPDMWFDANGNLITSCAGQTTCLATGATNDPGPGSLTFYWTNQQSGRLMFYHDHSYGITRLNVYAGEAAGYLIVDPAQENALAAANLPGTLGTTPDLSHMIPLVIQDKTFVPDNGVPGGLLAATDPTWDVANYGGKGSLWFPHIYIPNQNPSDVTGANGYGRWDYGPWFWPPQDPSTFVPNGQPVQCNSAAYSATNPPAFPPLMCPGTPNPSGVPEGFMDTPLLNGTAYPSLTVDPTAYRFQMLNAANDRTWNLGLYVAEPLSVAITQGGANYTKPPLVSFSGGAGSGAAGTAIMSTGAVTQVLVTGVGMGYTSTPNVTITGDGTGAAATAVVDPLTTTVSAINVTSIGTGYTYANATIDPPAGCTAGCLTATASAYVTPAGTVMGVNVTNYGSGYTSAPMVTFTNAAGDTTGAGAAAIASINTEVKMVDAVPHTAASTVPLCGQTNPTGGAMLVSALMDASGNPLNATGLPKGCWPSAWPTDGRDGGVPDPATAGPPINQLGTEGGLLPQLVTIPSTPIGYEYNRRSITVLNVFTHGLLIGPAERVDIMVDFSQFAGKTLIFYNDGPAPVPAFDSRNDYYTGDPDQTTTGGAPTTLPGYGPNTRTIMQIKVKPTAGGASLASVTVNNGGSGYKAPSVAFSGGGGSGAAAVASGTVSGITLTSAGSGYTNPTVTFSGGGGTGAAAQMTSGSISSLTLTSGGSGYASIPAVTFSGGGGSLAAAAATGSVNAVSVTNAGAGYATMPTVSFTGGGGTGAVAAATGAVDVVSVTNAGGGYAAMPTVSFTGGGGTGAAAAATGAVDAVTVGTPGAGYTAPAVSLTGGGGSGAAATASGAVDKINITSGGTGYTAPIVTLTGGGGTGASATATVTGGVITGFTVTGGSGYTAAPAVTITDVGPGTGATATATQTGGIITAITPGAAGSGYLNPVVTIVDPSGTGAVVTAAQTGGAISGYTITNGGTGYTNPVVTITDAGNGVGAVVNATISVTTITVTAAGSGFTAAPTVAIADTGTPVTPAAVTATLKVTAIAVSAGGSGYTAAPVVAFSGGAVAATATLKVNAVVVSAGGAGYTAAPAVAFSGGPAAATATLGVTALTISSPGSGYTSAPTVGFTGGGGTGAAAKAAISPTGIMLVSGGTGYTTAPTVTITDPTGTGAAATATLSINAVSLTSPGSAYNSVPAVTISDTGAGTGALATANLASGPAFGLASVANALPGIFASTQDKIILPEPQYPAANGGSANPTYVRIQDYSLTAWIGSGVGGLTLTSGGAGYTTAPAVAITGGGGTGATASAALAPGAVGSLTLTAGGSGYTTAPTISFSGGGGTGAAATATLAPRPVASVTMNATGNGYTSLPTVTFTAPQTAGGTTAVGTAVLVNRKVTAITINNPGSGYTAAPTITISGGGGSGARATAVLGPAAVASLTLTKGGSGYVTAPTITINGGGGSGATATAAKAPSVVASVTLTGSGTGYTTAPTVTFSGGGGSGAAATAKPPVTQMQPKTIQELFTLDYGRMNATLGVELPFTNFLTQTTIPYGYVDPPTEVFKDGETQIWKITHNGVDTHFIHFHLFTVQVINRVGWDGMIKPPDPNELAWKDTVRMNPLEDIVVALHPMNQSLPWDLPLSYRPMDVTESIGSSFTNQFTNVDPINQPATVTNAVINFGYEYVWHCHILGHEENDMMRAMAFAVPPQAPSAFTAALTGTGTGQQIVLTWADNSLHESGFTINRATSPGGPWTKIATLPASPASNALVVFTDSTVARRTTYYYQVIANNLVGYTQIYAAPAVGYPHISADSAPIIATATTN